MKIPESFFITFLNKLSLSAMMFFSGCLHPGENWIELKTIQAHKEATHALYFPKDGKSIATGGGYTGQTGSHGEVKLWSIPTLEQIGIFKRHKSTVEGIGAGPEPRTFTSGASEIAIWSEIEKSTLGFKKTGRLYKFMVSKNGKIAMSIQKGKATVWNLRSVGRLGSEISVDGGSITCGCLSSDGKLGVVGTTSSGIWTFQIGADTSKLTPIAIPVHSVLGVRLSETDQSRILAIGKNNALIYDISQQKILVEISDSIGFARDMAWSPDGRWIGVSSGFQTKIFDADSGNLTQTLSRESWSIAFSEDSKYMAVGGKGSLTLYSIR